MYIFSALSALMTLTLDINTLVEVMSIGTLFAYLVVSASVIVLRYRPPSSVNALGSQELSSIGEGSIDKSPVEDAAGQLYETFHMLKPYLNAPPGRLVTLCVLLFGVFTFLVCGFVKGCYSSLEEGSWWAIVILLIFLTCDVMSLLLIVIHQQSTAPLRYKVPLVPFLPALSIVVNAVLIVNLKAATWLRLLVWVAIGLSMYFFYGVGHSKLDATSSKSTLLKVGSPGPTSWGSVERESSFDSITATKLPEKTKSQVAASMSREFLVDNADISP
ncbi:probable cationic amino acid transporter [Uloborus diversus]|uniref:probable cationic amino acid transporter n=1 Tax=Uloborus diversus TaxID=327109 RepID=UPI0024094800|nr:probable cationic amino acid transporter [Uloborus diversus]